MSEWIKVVTQPTGLAAFGLFLVFGYLAKVKKPNERRWLTPIAVGLAAVALIGGLTLAYMGLPKPPVPAIQTRNPPPVIQQNADVRQSSSGDISPNVQGVVGDVVITMDQSNGKTNAVRKKPAEKAKKASQ